MSNNTATESKKFNLVKIFSMWKEKSKNGMQYFTGKTTDGTKLTAFYNTDKKNLKEPDLKVYIRTEDGLSKDPFVSLWCNTSKKGKKLLSGKIDGKKVIGFINEKPSEKQPYFQVYWSDEDQLPVQEEKPVKKADKKPVKKDEPKMEEIGEADLPF